MSRSKSNLPIGLTAITGLLLAAGAAEAATSTPQTQKLKVSAVIGDMCTVTTAALNFGAGYNGTAAVQATGAIDISCVATTSLGIALNGGQGPSGADGSRTMKNGTSSLLYLLYSDGPQTNTWLANEVVTKTITGAGSVPVWGTIPLQGNGHTAGLHTDEVTITLNFQ
jgi:spore coat protein U-like protein